MASTQQNSNSTKSISITEQSKKKPFIGLYDLQFGLGAITNGEMGLDIDAGATIINLSYDNDASATVEVHYDNAHDKFDNFVNYSRLVIFSATNSRVLKFL